MSPDLFEDFFKDLTPLTLSQFFPDDMERWQLMHMIDSVASCQRMACFVDFTFRMPYEFYKKIQSGPDFKLYQYPAVKKSPAEDHCIEKLTNMMWLLVNKPEELVQTEPNIFLALLDYDTRRKLNSKKRLFDIWGPAQSGRLESVINQLQDIKLKSRLLFCLGEARLTRYYMEKNQDAETKRDNMVSLVYAFNNFSATSPDHLDAYDNYFIGEQLAQFSSRYQFDHKSNLSEPKDSKQIISSMGVDSKSDSAADVKVGDPPPQTLMSWLAFDNNHAAFVQGLKHLYAALSRLSVNDEPDAKRLDDKPGLLPSSLAAKGLQDLRSAALSKLSDKDKLDVKGLDDKSSSSNNPQVDVKLGVAPVESKAKIDLSVPAPSVLTPLTLIKSYIDTQIKPKEVLFEKNRPNTLMLFKTSVSSFSELEDESKISADDLAKYQQIIADLSERSRQLTNKQWCYFPIQKFLMVFDAQRKDFILQFAKFKYQFEMLPAANKKQARVLLEEMQVQVEEELKSKDYINLEDLETWKQQISNQNPAKISDVFYWTALLELGVRLKAVSLYLMPSPFELVEGDEKLMREKYGIAYDNGLKYLSQISVAIKKDPQLWVNFASTYIEIQDGIVIDADKWVPVLQTALAATNKETNLQLVDKLRMLMIKVALPKSLALRSVSKALSGIHPQNLSKVENSLIDKYLFKYVNDYKHDDQLRELTSNDVLLLSMFETYQQACSAALAHHFEVSPDKKFIQESIKIKNKIRIQSDFLQKVNWGSFGEQVQKLMANKELVKERCHLMLDKAVGSISVQQPIATAESTVVAQQAPSATAAPVKVSTASAAGLFSATGTGPLLDVKTHHAIEMSALGEQKSSPVVVDSKASLVVHAPIVERTDKFILEIVRLKLEFERTPIEAKRKKILATLKDKLTENFALFPAKLTLFKSPLRQWLEDTLSAVENVEKALNNFTLIGPGKKR